MKNSIGNNVIFTLFGESHQEFIGAVIDGLPSGIKIDYDFINLQINKRKPKKDLSTPRVENDNYKIISGVFNGYTTGTPLTVIVENNNKISKDYSNIKDIPRPSHADYTNSIKYFGFSDYRGGGHSSGRVSIAIVIVGAICISALKQKNIIIGTHIKKLYDIEDKDFNVDEIYNQLDKINNSNLFVIDENIKQKMEKLILKTKEENDSIGGILETIILNLPTGLGEPIFDSMEGSISKALFSIGGVKGVEFGQGFNFSNMKGSNSNDEFYIENNKIKTYTNNNGGINGGISNGMPVLIKTVIKPTSSIFKTQRSVDLVKKENTTLTISGRHDAAIVIRAGVVLDSIISIVIMDLLITRYGQNWRNI